MVHTHTHMASLEAQLVKNLPAMQETGLDLIPGLGRSPGEENGNPLQYSCLENPTDRGAWKATVHGVTRVEHNLATKPPYPHPHPHTHTHTHTHTHIYQTGLPQWLRIYIIHSHLTHGRLSIYSSV